MVSALRKSYQRTIARRGRTEMAGIESCLATCLNKERAGSRGSISLHLRWQARNRLRGNGRALSARPRRTERGNRHGINWSTEIITDTQIAGFLIVEHCERDTSVVEDRSRHLPALYQRISAVTAQGRLQRDLPNIICTEQMTRIVLRWTIASAKIVSILGDEGTASSEHS